MKSAAPQSEMLIVLDSGNTAVSCGIYKKGLPPAFGSFKIDDIPKLASFLSKKGGGDQIEILISSVVPKNISIIKKSFSKLHPLKIRIAGANVPIKIRSKYRNEKKLGVDRKINIYGALHFYRPPFLIIDTGTAITADYVSKKGTFEGGLIIPGPAISFQALMDKTALLPKAMALPKKSITLIGKTTYECMNSGIIQGYSAMIDGLADRFRRRYGKNLKVIASGGFSLWLKPYVRAVDYFDPHLGLKALALLHQTAAKR
jgi:type III pantothenate kinase